MSERDHTINITSRRGEMITTRNYGPDEEGMVAEVLAVPRERDEPLVLMVRRQDGDWQIVPLTKTGLDAACQCDCQCCWHCTKVDKEKLARERRQQR